MKAGRDLDALVAEKRRIEVDIKAAQTAALEERKRTGAIDIAIAENVMGWKWHKLPPATDYGPSIRGYWYVGDEFEIKNQRAYGYSNRFPMVEMKPWSPSTDIAAAFDMLKVGEYRHGVPVLFQLNLYNDGPHCRMGWGTDNSSDTVSEAYGDTFAHAICLAALKAVGVEVE